MSFASSGEIANRVRVSDRQRASLYTVVGAGRDAGTHAPAAALHARRSTPKGVSRRRSACLQPLCRVQLVGREYPSSPLTGHALCVMCMAPIVNHTVKRERRG